MRVAVGAIGTTVALRARQRGQLSMRMNAAWILI
jgi:hypothetical protein